MNNKKVIIRKRVRGWSCYFVWFFLTSIGLTGQSFSQTEDLNVISGQQGKTIWMQYTDAPNALYHHLMLESYQLLDQRESQIAALRTREDWEGRQRQVREILMRIVGPFPERAPLNAVITGVVKKDGYTIEKTIFESRPGFHVTGALFLPKNRRGKTPAILYTPGHSLTGFRTGQQTILNLVKKGFIVFAIDPVGQGERLQYYEPETGVSRIGGPTHEHSYPGAQLFLSSTSMARYMIWDGMRAIDYLVSRPEVDPERLGIHGVSGGGTQSAYIAAFDNRILAAAPSNYITSYRRLLESIGPQDAEQNFYAGLAEGIDHADLLEVRAPKPVLVMATTRDFFNIQGVRETVREVQRIYQAAGAPENLETVEDDLGHGTTQKSREALYAFFQKHLGLPGDPAEQSIEWLQPEELQITKTGQLTTAMETRTVFQVNARETADRLGQLRESRKNLATHLPRVKQVSRELSGYLSPADQPQPVFTGRYRRQGYTVEKYFIHGEGEYPVPYLLMIPDTPGAHPALLYVHPNGKAAVAAPGGEMERFVKQGYVVLAPDLIGRGEMGPGMFEGDAYIHGVSLNIWFLSILNGRSIVGIQAGDLVRLVRVMEQRPEIDSRQIGAVAQGEMGAVLLHAALYEPAIGKVALIEPLISYKAVVMHQHYDTGHMLATVANALPNYDLPDLAAAVAPRPLLLVNMTDQNGHRAGSQQVEETYAVARKAYLAQEAVANFQIQTSNYRWEMEQILNPWLLGQEE